MESQSELDAVKGLLAKANLFIKLFGIFTAIITGAAVVFGFYFKSIDNDQRINEKIIKMQVDMDALKNDINNQSAFRAEVSTDIRNSKYFNETKFKEIHEDIEAIHRTLEKVLMK